MRQIALGVASFIGGFGLVDWAVARAFLESDPAAGPLTKAFASSGMLTLSCGFLLLGLLIACFPLIVAKLWPEQSGHAGQGARVEEIAAKVIERAKRQS